MKIIGIILLIFSSIFVIASNINLNNNCFYYSYFYRFEYDKGFNELIKNYERCKNDCTYIRTYNHLMAISTEENFKKIKETDIVQELKCHFGYYVPFGPVFYYFRKNNKSKLIELFDKKLLKEALGDYLYYTYFDNYENFKNLFEADPNNYFASVTAAYLMYKLGEIEKAKEIASIRYNHFKKEIEKKGLFFNGSINLMLEHYIYSIIFDIKLSEKEKEKLEKAKKNFPYLFSFYE